MLITKLNCTTALAVVAVATIFSGCAMTVPRLDPPLSKETTISAIDIVQRVKCEIYQATYPLWSHPKDYPWFQKWTAKVEITFLVNESDSLSPGLSLMTPFHNAYISKAGPSSIGGSSSTLSGVAQKATFGFGAGVSTQAARSEDVVFTMALTSASDDLNKKDIEDDVGDHQSRYHLDHGKCTYTDGFDLDTSNLGLDEWINNVIKPVTPDSKDNGFVYLASGYHEQASTQGGQKSLNPPPAKTTAGEVTYTQKFANYNISSEILKNIPTESHKIDAEDKALIVIASTIKIINDSNRNIESLHELALAHNATCTAKLGEFAKEAAKETEDSSNYVNSISDIKDSDLGKFQKELDGVVKAARASSAKAAIRKNEAQAAATRCTYSSGKRKIDPPYDSISHQVQFTVTTNAAATPNWSLALASGPSPSGSSALVSGSRADTHTLIITLAPSAMAAGDQNTNLLLRNVLQTSLGIQ